MKKLAELQAARARALAAWKKIVTDAEAANRDLTDDESTRAAAFEAEVKTADEQIARRRALDEAERTAPAIITQRGDGQYEERAREFSITNSIRAAMGEAVDVGRERELSQELCTRTGRRFTGIPVPDQALAPLQQRTITTDNSGGGHLIPTQHLAGQFIDRLRPSLLLPQLGATLLDGLIGDIDIPKQTGSSSAQWVAEDAPIDASDPDFDDLQLAPRTVGAITSFSRRMLINSVPSIEDLVRRDLASVIANAVDEAALLGGGGTMPIGVIATAGVHQISLAGGATWRKVLEFPASVEGADALGGALGWALSPWAKQILRATPKEMGAGEGWLMESPTELAGYRCATSSVLKGDPADSPPTDAIIVFGDWSQLILASWSGVDLLVNPYEGTAYSRGRVLVRAMRDVDVGVRHPSAFAFAADLATVES